MILQTPKQKIASSIQRVQQDDDVMELLAEIAGIDGSHWQLCVHPLLRDAPEWEALEKLANNALGANPFYDAIFLKAMRGRLIRKQEYHLVLWEIIGDEKVAKIAFPVQDRKTKSGNRLLRAYENEYSPSTTPLIDKNDADETISKFVQALDSAVEEHGLVLRIGNLCTDMPFGDNFLKAIEGLSANKSVTLNQKRAALFPEINNAGGLTGLSSKRQREHRRLSTKLSELGQLEFERVDEFMDVLLRFEEFLLLEVKGWKGRKGTSMQMLKKASVFARQAVTDFASAGKCEIFSLRLDGNAIAIVINFHQDGRNYPWKIAFDEKYANRSPGSVLMYHMSQELLTRPDFVMADSLAKPGKSWLSAIWHDHTSFNDIIVGPSNKVVNSVKNSIPLKTRLKDFAKKILGR
ncbi:MAG: hypothetical protein COC17_05515 [Hyphomicrobiales bacterium]|nr:GNAT family N-acetyltransferase [Hyphomicrobiales bacterium]PCH50387.1 MAG: hypothetical protein COC17_05515 [Hyphomicrobiales bacterium]